MTPKSPSEETTLGFDLSTQKLKAVILNAGLEVLAHADVKFDSDLPEYRTTGGVSTGAAKNEFYVQPTMWIKALDMAMDRLVCQGVDFSTIVAISGSAQQHGSLYWSKHGVETLKNLDSDKFLHTQVDESAFTLTRTPIWMDGSTTRQCEEMEAAIGGQQQMLEITGSKCYPRFTGPQIRKVYQTRSDCYENTERISLVSSFLASLFIGNVAPIDLADGSGMNLLDINTGDWSQICLNACAPDLEQRLGKPVPTSTCLGKVAPFFVQRYNINAACKVFAFTGDNLSALAGMLVGTDWLALSLGTSDTIMMGLSTPTKHPEGHVLIHPIDEGRFMGLLCFRNGSLVRDIFKRAEGNNNWEYFSELLESTPRGNFGNMALHFVQQEIFPPVKGSLRWNKSSGSSSNDLAKGVAKFSSPQIEIRALVEGQMIHRRAVAQSMGFSSGENTRIIATGGASANKAILQVVADVFKAPVYVQNNTEAALLGAAFRASYYHYLSTSTDSPCETFYEYIGRNLSTHHMHRVCDPIVDNDNVYSTLLQRYHEMVHILMRDYTD